MTPKPIYQTSYRPHIIVVILLILLTVLFISSCQSAQASVSGALAASEPQINIPDLDQPNSEETVFWFGQVDSTQNYADVRIGYNSTDLVITAHVFDRWLWYDTTPNAAEMSQWDAVSIYLDQQMEGTEPSGDSLQFTGQLYHFEQQDDTTFQAAYSWQTGSSSWQETAVPFATNVGWRGNAPNEDSSSDRGWNIRFYIPWSSLGLTQKPAAGTTWRLAMALHDRDNATGTPAIANQIWPVTMQDDQPTTWATLHFGMPAYVPPTSAPGDTVIVRQGLNGRTVPDTEVGGSTICGDPYKPSYFDGWGSANYSGSTFINIQNQWDVADWPCFSKYYVTFPLDDLPPNAIIESATLQMHLFGNAEPNLAKPSLIHVYQVRDDWQENTLTWNNAPYVWENIDATWVQPETTFPGWPGVAYDWDVSRAVAAAQAQNQPLRLALYTSAGDYHSGKYFSTSDVEEWNAEARPTLTITWGTPAFSFAAAPAVQPLAPGGQTTFDVTVTHGVGFNTAVSLTATPDSADITAVLNKQTITAPGETVTLTITDVRNSPPSTSKAYAVTITATGDALVQTQTVYAFVNAKQLYLPIINQPS